MAILQLFDAPALPLGLPNLRIVRDALGKGFRQSLIVCLFPCRKAVRIPAFQQSIPLLPHLFPGFQLLFSGDTLRELPVQGPQPCFLFLRQAGSIRIGPALDPLPGVGCSGQIFLLGTQRLQRRISLRISPIQVRKFLLPPPDLPAQPLQIFLLQAQRLPGIGLPDSLPQKCLLRSFFVFLPVQGVNLLANRFQQLLFLCRAVNGRFQLPHSRRSWAVWPPSPLKSFRLLRYSWSCFIAVS